MTAIGVFGSLIVFSTFYLSIQNGRLFLLGGVLGLGINWLGDSLDGRLAYYRNIPRKWYGFALDILMDWLSIIIIGLGFYFYAEFPFKILAFLFVVLYCWSMLIALLRYRITRKYRIDSGAVGPTELRIIIAVILLVEIVYPGSINYLAIAITIALFAINLVDTLRVLDFANDRDEKEKKIWTKSAITLFIKAQAAALAGGLTDYGLMIVLTEALKIHFTISILISGTIGGFINFSINRFWAFKCDDGFRVSPKTQLLRFALVVLGSIFLKSLGTYILYLFLRMDYRFGRLIIDSLVSYGFNYPLIKYWVFRIKSDQVPT